MLGYFSGLVDRLSMSSALPVAAVAVIPVIAMRMTGSSVGLDVVSIYLLAAVTLDSMTQVQTRAMLQRFGGNIPKPVNIKGGGSNSRPSKKRKRRR